MPDISFPLYLLLKIYRHHKNPTIQHVGGLHIEISVSVERKVWIAVITGHGWNFLYHTASLSSHVHRDVSLFIIQISSSSSSIFFHVCLKYSKLTSKSTLFSHFQYSNTFVFYEMYTLRVFISSLIWNNKKNVTALTYHLLPLLLWFLSYLFAVITKSNCCRFLLSMIDLRLKVVA